MANPNDKRQEVLLLELIHKDLAGVKASVDKCEAATTEIKERLAAGAVTLESVKGLPPKVAVLEAHVAAHEERITRSEERERHAFWKLVSLLIALVGAMGSALWAILSAKGHP